MQPAAELSQFAVLEERIARLELTVATLQQRLDALGQIEGQLEELVAHLQQEAATLAQAEGQTEHRLKAVEHELIESRTDHEDF
jgi:hypothetical protein